MQNFRKALPSIAGRRSRVRYTNFDSKPEFAGLGFISDYLNSGQRGR
jgi:hypothetical protein